MAFIIEKDIKIIKIEKYRCKKIIFSALLLILVLHLPVAGNADAWVQNKHEGVFISSYEMRSFIGTNYLLRYDKNIQYTQGVLNLYGEYGLTNRITLGAKIIAIDSMLVDGNFFLGKVKKRSIGIDVGQFITRIGLVRNNKIVALSIIAGIATPSFYHKNQASQFAIRKYKQISGIEVGIKINKTNFFTFTANYYWNINHWYNETRFEAMYGYYFLQNLLLMVRFQEIIYHIHNEHDKSSLYPDVNQQIFNFIANSGFAKLTMSFAIPVMQNLTLELGVYTSIKSKLLKTKYLGLNMRGCFISLWYNF